MPYYSQRAKNTNLIVIKPTMNFNGLNNTIKNCMKTSMTNNKTVLINKGYNEIANKEYVNEKCVQNGYINDYFTIKGNSDYFANIKNNYAQVKECYPSKIDEKIVDYKNSDKCMQLASYLANNEQYLNYCRNKEPKNTLKSKDIQKRIYSNENLYDEECFDKITNEKHATIKEIKYEEENNYTAEDKYNKYPIIKEIQKKYANKYINKDIVTKEIDNKEYYERGLLMKYLDSFEDHLLHMKLNQVPTLCCNVTDPHVKVMGLEEQVESAKRRILSVLEIKSDRVTMKIDVSYTDHSHIIGRSGMTIKNVMEETQCHIHFPDSNRNNQNEKSNQVSISGKVQAVEMARARVRELMPLMFCFDLPINMGALDPNSPTIKEMEASNNIQIMVRSRQKLNSTLVVVKGCEWEVDRVKEATQLLIRYTCDHLASQIQVHMMLEISPQHQRIVLGENNRNLIGIMKRTNTQIMFVDPNDPNIPTIKKSNVTITGNIDNVYLARQQLIGSLPVVIMFDVPDTSVIIDCEKIEQLMNTLDVYINPRTKLKQNYVSFIIKGIERNIDHIYEARRQLLDSDEREIRVQVPSSYQIPPNEAFKTNFCNPPICVSSPLIPSGAMVGKSGNVFEFPWPGQGVPPPPGYAPQTPAYQPQPASPAYPPVPPSSPAPASFFHQNLPQLHPAGTAVPLPPHLYHLGHLSHSSQSLPDHFLNSLGKRSNYSSPSTSPRATSPLPPMHERPNTKLPGSDGHLNEREREWMSPRSSREIESKKQDYHNLKFQAVQAVQKEIVPDELRVPNATWAGFGFSQSSPHQALAKELKHQESNNNNPNKKDWREIWGDGCVFPVASSNYLEAVPQQMPTQYNNIKDLRTLLTCIGCDKYLPLFLGNEIDLATFRMLTENDLKDIGITTFGARRKMAFCIAEMNRQQTSFNGSAAPGAEREGKSNW